jgi:hypothetical protein
MEAITNPILEAADRARMLISHRFKLSFEALYSWEKPLREEIFDKIRIYCHQNSMNFMIRPFNNTVEEDRDAVEKLPAVQVYYEDIWQTTFYLDNDFEISLFRFLAKIEAPKKSAWFTIPSFSLPFKRKRMILTSS